MRIKHEIGRIEVPRNLLISKKTTHEVLEFSLEKPEGTVSPETQSHRFKQGWQHLQDLPENIINNNNNYKRENLNTNSSNSNNLDDVTLDLPQGHDERAKDVYNSNEESDDSRSSSEDEDSSVSFSDTSPLLDVSSLDSSSSNESSDTDMSEDDADCLPDDDNEVVNNNYEEPHADEDHSMESSWMSFSSVGSSESHNQKPSHSVDLKCGELTKRNGIVLPDVLPVGIPKREDEMASDRKELELQLRRRELKLDATPRIPKDCCIVEITAQPDIQVDIRLKPAPNRPFSDSYIEQRNTYPREVATKNYNFFFKTREVERQCTKRVKTTISSPGDHSRYFAIGEGVRLNNFTLVNGFKALSLTELVKSNSIVKENNGQCDENNSTNRSGSMAIEKAAQTNYISNRQSTEYDGFPRDTFNLHSKENRRHRKGYMALEHKPNIESVKHSYTNSLERNEKNNVFHVSAQNSINKSSESILGRSEPIKPCKIISTTPVNSAQYSYQQKQLVKDEQNEKSSPKTSSKNQTSGKLSSPELFEVYTMETAVPHINWATSVPTVRTNRENEWLKKRQNDREEIRRKLAMDSDNEDYVAENLNKNQKSTYVDRSKGSSNLQICFLNEAAKDQPDSEQITSLERTDVSQKPSPRMLKRNLLFPPSLPKCALNSSKLQNNNNVPQSQVMKRQRPTFFFNRPRSWHAAKVDEKPGPVEDLHTCHQRLQEEAREALAQAKEMARMQMEIEQQKKKKSPIADIVGISFPDGHNLLSRHALLDMNVAQLQVIVNDLHSQIETLNEDLVKFLLERDDLHMEQDSMLVDIEDLTRYLGLKGSSSMKQIPDSKFATNFQGGTANKN